METKGQIKPYAAASTKMKEAPVLSIVTGAILDAEVLKFMLNKAGMS